MNLYQAVAIFIIFVPNYSEKKDLSNDSMHVVIKTK